MASRIRRIPTALTTLCYSVHANIVIESRICEFRTQTAAARQQNFYRSCQLRDLTLFRVARDRS